MPDYSMTPVQPLGGFDREFDGVRLAELSGCALVSVATPLGGDKALEKVLSSAYKVKRPDVGSSTVSKLDNSRFLGLQQDQMFVLFDHDDTGAAAIVAGRLGDAGYYTDQSDSWAMLTISGPKSRSALERICPIDLDRQAFPEGAVTRTVMEHLGTIIVCEGEDSFVLMSARSSAKSFLHAVETSIQNIS